MPAPTSEATQAAILKPELGFEAFFQGQQAVDGATSESVPVPFFQWENRQPPDPFDPFAGKDGYDPDLMRFLPCGKSTPIELWIPIMADSAGPSAGLVRRYRYRLYWRLQSLARAQDETLAGIANQYHIPYDAPGAPDTSGGPPARRRNIMPCAIDTTASALVDIDGATGYPPITSTARDFYVGDSIIVDIGPTGRPLVKGSRAVAVRGVYQQGIVDPAVITSDYPFIPDFAICEVIARGDQLMIVADRIGIDDTEPANWDFAGWDSGFSNLYGTDALGTTPHPPFPDVGIYVFFESSPRGPALQRIGPLPNAPPTP